MWNRRDLPASCVATSLFPPAFVLPQTSVLPLSISLSRMTLVSCSKGFGVEPSLGVEAIIPKLQYSTHKSQKKGRQSVRRQDAKATYPCELTPLAPAMAVMVPCAKVGATRGEARATRATNDFEKNMVLVLWYKVTAEGLRSDKEGITEMNDGWRMEDKKPCMNRPAAKRGKGTCPKKM